MVGIRSIDTRRDCALGFPVLASTRPNESNHCSCNCRCRNSFCKAVSFARRRSARRKALVCWQAQLSFFDGSSRVRSFVTESCSFGRNEAEGRGMRGEDTWWSMPFFYLVNRLVS